MPMKRVFIILRQNTKGDHTAYSTGKSYPTRDLATKRIETLEKQARLLAVDRKAKPKFWVEPITVTEE